MISLADLFGWLATVVTALIFLPQLIKAWTTGMTEDISMMMIVLAILGNALWLVHALLTVNVPLITCASLIIFISTILMVFKYRNERS